MNEKTNHLMGWILRNDLLRLEIQLLLTDFYDKPCLVADIKNCVCEHLLAPIKNQCLPYYEFTNGDFGDNTYHDNLVNIAFDSFLSQIEWDVIASSCKIFIRPQKCVESIECCKRKEKTAEVCRKLMKDGAFNIDLLYPPKDEMGQ